jgi:glyoxylase-like metal-dependent hydrolase (beta-lactamase superfamily II)
MADWSIWMLEYARTEDHPTPRSLYGVGYEERGYFPFSYVLLEGHGHLALIDTGFDPGSTFINRFLHESTVRSSASAAEVLGRVGVRPEDVDSILLTHAHFDHMGNLPAFPNAHVWIQSREIEQWEHALALPARFASLTEALDPGDLLHLEEVRQQGRLTLVDGLATNVLPGVDLVPAFDSHTDGSQYVVVRCGHENWVMTGDNAYSYRNVETSPDNPLYRGIGYGNGSLWRSLFVLDEMMQRADSSSRLIIPHEGQTFARFDSRRHADGLGVAEMHLAAGGTTRLDRHEWPPTQ